MFIFLWDRYIYKRLRWLLFLDYALVVRFVMLEQSSRPLLNIEYIKQRHNI